MPEPAVPRRAPSCRGSTEADQRPCNDRKGFVWRQAGCSYLDSNRMERCRVASISRPFQWARPGRSWPAMAASSYGDGLVYVWLRHAWHDSNPFLGLQLARDGSALPSEQDSRFPLSGARSRIVNASTQVRRGRLVGRIDEIARVHRCGWVSDITGHPRERTWINQVAIDICCGYDPDRMVDEHCAADGICGPVQVKPSPPRPLGGRSGDGGLLGAAWLAHQHTQPTECERPEVCWKDAREQSSNWIAIGEKSNTSAVHELQLKKRRCADDAALRMT
jgi:hypothetical protein